MDLEHALQTIDDHDEAALIDILCRKDVDDARHLVQDLLEPQLVHLMDHDEEMLLVGGLAILCALGLDRIKKRIDLEVLAIVHASAVIGTALLGHDGGRVRVGRGEAEVKGITKFRPEMSGISAGPDVRRGGVT